MSMNSITDNMDVEKLSFRDLLLLLNERYARLSTDITQNNHKMDSFFREQNEMKIEMERLKTTMKIYATIAVFVASSAASLLTALIVK